MRFEYPALELLMAGRRVGVEGRKTEPVLNPSTGEVLGQLPHATHADIEEAVAAAAMGFQLWRSTPSNERARILRRTADLMRERRELLARLITLELGKPIAESRLEVEQAAGMFEWNAEEGKRAYGRVIPARAEHIQQIAVKEPIGPIAAFSPWNAPAITPSRKISGALAAGCSVIIKPSEETPATALAIGGMLLEAGLPDGVLSIVFGDPIAISRQLIEAPAIRGITFTGSTNVGKQLATLAVQGMKRMTLELGGHAPVIIFDDVNIDAVAKSAAMAKYRNAGQVCTSPTRFYVHQSVHDQFVEKFAEHANAIKIGDGFDSATVMGPLANARRVDSMDAFVGDARSRGIRVAAGGERTGNRGFFYRPTLLANTHNQCMAANVEPFGPLAITAPFGSFDEAITLANRLPFGLAAYAMTKDITRAKAVAAAIESGNVILNHWQVSLPETPFGGHKESGVGLEGGVEGLLAFQNTKFVSQASA
ncbi:NAD-dependent succinate-semialdehyde dehydrogenase [Bradyrhizobium vignae]|uniref:NAD-dependent succinate-semialdehyde dehydrogenase n=1 Tax=Bradyrhizobium vignae TaxID=1549949 RepID=UPI00100A7540|nr:NAD-dependent succinate-semialdehyde dehydrogenase [Bradyrhizobium vignae]RXG90921.1 NAD-dependent succinate-semialdehyde dehydrogenase [Bradyrhizobium vignae]